MDTRDGVQLQMGHNLGEAIHAALITSYVTSICYVTHHCCYVKGTKACLPGGNLSGLFQDFVAITVKRTMNKTISINIV